MAGQPPEQRAVRRTGRVGPVWGLAGAAAVALLAGCDSAPSEPGPPGAPPSEVDAGLVDASIAPEPELHAFGALPQSRADVQLCLQSYSGTTAPARLSDSGCLSDTARLAPAVDLIPYLVNAPLWTDGAIKQRYISLPPGSTIDVAADGTWSFPDRSVLVKHFLIEGVRGDPQTRYPVETRLMVRRGGSWRFLKYRWNEARTDAERLEGQVIEPMSFVLEGGTQQDIDYLFPSHGACTACHSIPTKLALGPRTEQINRPPAHRPGTNQLDAFEALGLFTAPAGANRPSIPDPSDRGLSAETRARAWLHANCAHCHQPGGWAPPTLDLDLRFSRTLEQARICDVYVQYPLFPRLGRWRLRPGRPQDSTLYTRLVSEPVSRMPPAGVSWPDPDGAALVREWITQLSACP